jgi:flavin-dependent dehydrogenase
MTQSSLSQRLLTRPVVVVGAGLGGLAVALELARQRQVIVLAKRELHRKRHRLGARWHRGCAGQ